MSELDTLYQQLILEHAKACHGKGLTELWDGESYQVNPTCGDNIRLRVNLLQKNGKQILDNFSWDGSGCSISQASVSIMNDLVTGLDVAKINELTDYFTELMHSQGKGLADQAKADALSDAMAFAGTSQYPMRIKCALLGWMALRDAIAKALAGDKTPAVEQEDLI